VLSTLAGTGDHRLVAEPAAWLGRPPAESRCLPFSIGYAGAPETAKVRMTANVRVWQSAGYPSDGNRRGSRVRSVHPATVRGTEWSENQKEQCNGAKSTRRNDR
jgi:hypothetical protein